jgi:hypothetical protein
MKNYFKNVTSFEDLKAQYKVLLKANHPDNGGELEAMQEINCEYDALFKIWKDKAIKDNTLKEEEKEETAAGTRKKFYTAYGWEGSRYDSNLSIKEIAKSVRIYVKKKYPTCKFSVRTEHASMCREIIMEIKEFPEKMYKTGDDLRKEKIDWNADEIRDLMSKLRNHGFYDMGSFTQEDFVKEYEAACKESSFYALKTDYFKAVLEDVNAFVLSYNRDDSDGMIDYFNTNFYFFGCKFDNCKQVEKVARLKDKKPKDATTPAVVNREKLEEKESLFSVKVGEHTRTHEKLYLVKCLKTLDRKTYLSVVAQIKEIGGYYSTFTHSFIFRTNPEEALKGIKIA